MYYEVRRLAAEMVAYNETYLIHGSFPKDRVDMPRPRGWEGAAITHSGKAHPGVINYKLWGFGQFIYLSVSLFPHL